MDAYSILAIDNEPYSLVWLQNYFNRPDLGFVCNDTATGALDALRMMERRAPDLVISDIRMPQMDGIAFLRETQKRSIPSKVVLVSAFADFSYAQNAVRHGAIDYLLKPVSEEDVVRVLDKVRGLMEQEGGRAQEKGPSDSSVSLDEGDREPHLVMRQFIHEHYQEAIHIRELAEVVHLNANYCGALFQRSFGVTFCRYLTDLRVRKAAELLENSGLQITQVAEKVGFSDVFYFSKVFKQETGLSPSDYRRQAHGQAEE